MRVNTTITTPMIYRYDVNRYLVSSKYSVSMGDGWWVEQLKVSNAVLHEHKCPKLWPGMPLYKRIILVDAYIGKRRLYIGRGEYTYNNKNCIECNTRVPEKYITLVNLLALNI